MALFTGTSSDDVITTWQISPGVTALPAGSMPSGAADTINGLGGNDQLDGGGGGGDIINGGDGSDYTIAINVGNIVHGNGGDDAIYLLIRDTGGANDVSNSVYGDAGNDTVRVTYYSTYTDIGQDWLGDAPTGSLLLHGGAGNDELGIFCGVGFAPDTSKTTSKIYGEAGNDKLWATALDPNSDGSYYPGDNSDSLYGGTGNDEYFVLEAKDVVVEKPGEGTDTVIANQTDYTLPANTENLTMEFNFFDHPDPKAGWSGTGNDMANVITGAFAMVDRLNGLGGDDTIYGGSDYDGSGAGTDVIRGGSGNDKLYGGDSDNDPADGSDTISGGDGNDDVWAGGGNDTVDGGAGNDNLYGQSGNDTMRGGAGNERVYGGTGTDTLYGDADIDTMRGGEGLDRLTGGLGNDIFQYLAVGDSKPGTATRDLIFDFGGIGGAPGDRVDLSTIDADSGRSGNQAFTFMGTDAFTGVGQVRLIGSGTDTLIQANTGGSLAPELEVAVQDAGIQPGQWAASDFIL